MFARILDRVISEKVMWVVGFNVLLIIFQCQVLSIESKLDKILENQSRDKQRMEDSD